MLIKKTLTSLVAAAALSLPSTSFAKPRDGPYYGIGDWSRPVALATNVLIGGLEGAIGHMHHSKKKWDWAAFGKGFAKGALGGTIVYAGYEVAGAAEEFPLVGWFGVKVADLGHSMVHNALDGKSLLDRYESYVGPLYLSIDKPFEKPKVHWALHTGSFLGLSYAVLGGYKLDLKHSLSYLTPIFKMDRPIIPEPALNSFAGVTLGTTILYYDDTDPKIILPHENVHRAQIGRFNAANDIFPLLKENHLVLFGDLSEFLGALKGYMICRYVTPTCYAPYANLLEFEAYTFED